MICEHIWDEVYLEKCTVFLCRICGDYITIPKGKNNEQDDEGADGIKVDHQQ